ncbi:gliding motility-associated C-terminal domain-containing protein [Filimonas lacunae]|uniref:Gliding motility-associated C-terminal domain-containing protein n=1 Tax=Filimonas lacunae TaxID=477680 RepID=A0A173MIG4_9BACT|nr:LamG-like jellyroll fold domain-containing protein [Filimonas lacunae]BAV07198.1 CHU large protein [Filimonas lacunae]SIS93387.1 gliding motility-associated C-terminal domain-containing protein [Filimonas lacunae]
MPDQMNARGIRKWICCLVIYGTCALLFFPRLSAQSIDLNNGLVGYYPFNGNANDASGNGNNGTVSGAVLTTDRFGVANGAYSFNGYSSYIALPFTQLFQFKPTDAYSLSVWVQVASSSGVRSVLVKSDNTTPYQNSRWNYGICITDNYQVSVGYHDNLVLRSDGSLTTNAACWDLITYTYDNGKWQLYVNGTLVKQDNSQTKFSLIDNNSVIVFGKKGLSNGDYFSGKIDEARIYNRVLTADEAKYLYTQGTPCAVQNTAASFTLTDTVCKNTAVTAVNTSQNASSYYWNFNTASIQTQPLANNLGNIDNTFRMPVFSDLAEDNGNYYVFVNGHVPGELVRLDFGNSLLNTPTATLLGTLNNVLKKEMEGIQIIKNEGKWYGFIVGGNTDSGPSYLIKIEFGANLNNPSPVATNLGNGGGLNFPIDLHIFKEGNVWYGLTVNAKDNSVTRFNFTNSFDNLPGATNLGVFNGNLNVPTGIFCIKQNNQWYAFVTNDATSNGVTRLSFGNSITNTPTATTFTNQPLFTHMRDITMMVYCDGIVGFALNGDKDELLRLDFGNDITSTPQVTSYGNTGNLNFPHSLSRIFRVGGDLYSFITNVDNNTITRVRFAASNTVSGATSTLASPAAVSYTSAGNYNVNLVIDEGLPTQSSYCKNITVLDVPDKVPLLDTAVCLDSVVLRSRFVSNNTWSDGSKLDSLVIKASGTYWVNMNVYGCAARDSFVYRMENAADIDMGSDTAFCRGGQLEYHFQLPNTTYQWQDGSTSGDYIINQPGVYKLVVTNDGGCTKSDSVTVSVIELPVVQLMADTTICNKDQVQLRADVLQYTDSVRWRMDAGLVQISSVNPIVTPSGTTRYKLTAYNRFCAAADSLLITVLDIPVLTVSKDTEICKGMVVPLQASGAVSYNWWPDEALTNATAASQQIQPDTTITMYVKGKGPNGCAALDSIRVEVVNLPIVKLMADTAICEDAGFYIWALQLQFTDSIRWSPATNLSSTVVKMPAAKPASDMVYTAVVYNRFCAASDEVTVNVNRKPLLQVTNDTAICIGDVLPLSASGAAVYNWWPKTYLSDATISNPVASPSNTIRYYVTGTGGNGCSRMDSVQVVVQEPAVFSITPTSAIICEGDSITLSVSGGDAYQWLFTQSGVDATQASIYFAPALSGTYAVIGYDNVCHREDTLTVPVTIYALPVLAISKSNDIDCVKGDARLQVTGASYYHWYPAATLSDSTSYQPLARTDSSIMYHVQATSNQGCMAEDSIMVYVLKNNFNAYPIATGFTPNGDGLNDCFRVNQWGFIHKLELVIYNRLGERVFASNDPYACWDGTYKGEKQLPGTYIYTIKAETLCGPVVRNGTVVLLR